MKFEATPEDIKAREMILNDAPFWEFDNWLTGLLHRGQLSFEQMFYICLWVRGRLFEDIEQGNTDMIEQSKLFWDKVLEICESCGITPDYKKEYEGIDSRDLSKIQNSRINISTVLDHIEKKLNESDTDEQ